MPDPRAMQNLQMQMYFLGVHNSGCPKRQELTVHTVTTAFELGFCFIYIRN